MNDGDAGGDDADDQRRARAVDRAHEDVAAGLVGAEPEVACSARTGGRRVGHLALEELVRAVVRRARAISRRGERQEDQQR